MEAMAATDQQPTTFLSLPGEIRNTIYAFALRHDENDGVTSPVAPENKRSDVLVNGIMTIVDGRDAFLALTDVVSDAFSADYRWHIVDTSVKPATTTRFHGHMCTIACLLQPALTRVSSQVRSESVALFYDVNKFHFEAYTFNITTSKSPKDWWRGIGDSNLRHIKHLCIIDRKSSPMEFRILSLLSTAQARSQSNCTEMRHRRRSRSVSSS